MTTIVLADTTEAERTAAMAVIGRIFQRLLKVSDPDRGSLPLSGPQKD